MTVAFCTDFDSTLKRPVASRYAEGIFNQLMRPDGQMFNVSTNITSTLK